MKKEDICAFTLRIPVSLKIRLDILASKKKRSTNNLITVILQDYMDNQDAKK
jgi:predicted transcriptional regulator